MPMDRLGEWEEFADKVKKHIWQYTIPQYYNEDSDTDQVGAWDSLDCINAIKRYVNRFGRNQRGNTEALRDLLKIAHYAQFAYDRLKKETQSEDVY